MRRQAERLTEETGVDAVLTVEGPLPALPMAAEVVLLRGAQEALANIRKHSRATKVSLRLSAVDGSVRLSMIDDGRGFRHRGGGVRGRGRRAEPGQAAFRTARPP